MTVVAANLNRQIGVTDQALDTLMPMHLRIDAEGRCEQAGPTLAKMIGRPIRPGEDVFDLIEFRRPRAATTMAELRDLTGQRLTLALRAAPLMQLRGTVTDLPGRAGVILDVSLGLSFARAVAEFGLTLSDFSPCDQTVELMYLHEANASTARLSRRLSERLEAARATAEAQALTDALTGLSNRRAMDIELSRALADPTEAFALFHIDLDLFKMVNDTYGHAAGDHVLARVGDILRAELRRTDTAARTGGDEFLAILRDSVTTEAAGAAAERLIGLIEAPIPFEGETCRISASIGIALSDGYDTPPTADRMINDTDLALYAAKRGGRGRFCVHHPGLDTIEPGRRMDDPTPRPAPPTGQQKGG